MEAYIARNDEIRSEFARGERLHSATAGIADAGSVVDSNSSRSDGAIGQDWDDGDDTCWLFVSKDI